MNKPETEAECRERLRRWSIDVQTQIEMETDLYPALNRPTRQPAIVAIPTPKSASAMACQRPINLSLQVIFLVATLLIVIPSIGSIVIQATMSGNPVDYLLAGAAAAFLFYCGYLLAGRIFGRIH